VDYLAENGFQHTFFYSNWHTQPCHTLCGKTSDWNCAGCSNYLQV